MQSPIPAHRKSLFFVCGVAILIGPVHAAAADGPPMPMPIPHEHSIVARWMQKPVLDWRLLDDMESTENWSHHGYGEMRIVEDRVWSGLRALRLTAPTYSGKAHPGGRPFGEAVVRREFEGEDWSKFNRLSFRVYPHLPGFRVISLSARLINDGEIKLPNHDLREGLSFFILEPDKWNHIVWEIANLPRERVTGVEFVYRLQGNEPGATATVQYDFDRLELQRVEADHYEGWNVAPGRIAFSHTGYSPDARKTALATGLAADTFQLLRDGYDPVLTKFIRTTKSELGEFQVLDFSEFRELGTYTLRAGEIETRPFRIDPNVWRDTIWKTINLFYCERCGDAVPGIHDVCHRDWQGADGDRRIVINGGWHDAGDLSQGLVNTSEADLAMFQLAERIGNRDPALRDRLVEEAQWGLDWILKSRFENGSRVRWSTMDFWTDGVMGTIDDQVSGARSSSRESLNAAAAEAAGYRVLKTIDPIRASYALETARKDWSLAVERMRENAGLERAAARAIASIELFKSTGEQEYADRAAEFAKTIIDSQQRAWTDWDVPFIGFFYTDPQRDRILHYSHRSHEDSPVVALAELCHLLPDHADWMDWYSAVVLYSEYMRKAAEYTQPYRMLTGSIYHEDEYRRDESMREQVLTGIPLGKGYYLRRFPVWRNGFRGNDGTILSQASALADAAHLRGDADLLELCRRQLEWNVGRNPFSQSLMYGEGYDFAPQYSAMSGNLVGSLPVGVHTHWDRDVPYWPAANCYNYKEVWVHPSSRWLALMADLAKVAGRPEPIASDASFSITTAEENDRSVTFRLTAKGMENARFEIRAWNLEPARMTQQLMVAGGESAEIGWKLKKAAPEQPWIVVAFPASDFAARQEIVSGDLKAAGGPGE